MLMVVETLHRFLARYEIGPCRLGVAVSGGVDSTALLHAMAELRVDGYEIVALHVNHRLRGAASAADEEFVHVQCATLGVELHVGDGTLPANTQKARGIEAAARAVRYAQLRSLRAETACRFVATAHQKDDQAETVLMRLRHGAGVEGLRGILPLREDGFIRPMLAVRRADLAAFLHRRAIVPQHDASNDDLRFERNRVRAMLRDGSLRDLAPDAPDGSIVNALAQVAAHAQDLWPELEATILAAEAEHILDAAGLTRFVSWPDDRWMRRTLLRRAIRRLDPDARDVSSADLERLTAAPEETRRVTVTKTLELFRDHSSVLLRRRPDPRPLAFEVPLVPGRAAGIPELGVTISVRRVSGHEPLTLRTQHLRDRNAQLFELPQDARPEFVVRSRRPGDRFQPLGLGASKRLKELLIDRRIAAEARGRLPLLVWNGEIVWVAGVEVSERFKVGCPAGAVYEVRMEVSGAGDDTHSHVHR